MVIVSHCVSSSILPPLNLSSLSSSYIAKSKQHYQSMLCPGRRSRCRAMAAKRDHRCEWDYGGRFVDESMVILRKRIHEMKMVERNYEPPEDWMEWEKQCYGSYDEHVCFLVGLLQCLLMNSRPSVALGMVALTVMSVPLSMVMLFSGVMEGAHDVISALH